MDVGAAVAEERLRVADFLEGLTPEQWQTPSCCGEWTIQQTAAHLLAGPINGLKGSMPYMFKALFRPNVANDLAARALAEMGPERLVAELRANADHPFVPPGFPPESPLIDVVIHSQDMGRPLGIELDVPTERWLPALESATAKKFSIISASKHLKGLSFATTDLDWSVGSGPAIEGPARDLAHAMWGRAAALDSVSGDGVAQLRSRLSN